MKRRGDDSLPKRRGLGLKGSAVHYRGAVYHPGAVCCRGDEYTPDCGDHTVDYNLFIKSHLARMQLLVTSLGDVPREQKMLKRHLPRVIYHQVY